jgi:hypothetical protein
LSRVNFPESVSITRPVPNAVLTAATAAAANFNIQGTAFADDTAEAHAVPNAGDYHFRANPGAEKHLNDPAAIAALQAAVQVGAHCWWVVYVVGA